MQPNRINCRNVFCSKQSPPDLAQSTFSSLCAKNDSSFDSIRLPIFLLSSSSHCNRRPKLSTRQILPSCCLAYLTKLLEVSRSLSLGLMVPKDVLVGANIPSAHPAFADVSCRLAFYGRRTDAIVPSKSQSVDRMACYRSLEEDDDDGKNEADGPSGPADERAGMTAELTQTLAEHGISSSAAMSTDEALVYRLLDSVAADGGLTEDAKKEVRAV